MKNKKIFSGGISASFFTLMLCLLLFSCSQDSPKGNNEYKPIELNAAQTRAVKASNSFALKLGAAIQQDDEKENVVYSPLSVHVVLSMLANGANPETLQEMIEVLGNGASLSDINALNSDIVRKLIVADRNVQIACANSLWVNKDIEVTSAFSNILESQYKASLFSKSNLTASIADINNWVSGHTMGLIPEFIAPGTILNDFLCVNASAFSGLWMQAFNPADTKPGEFYNAGEDQPVMVEKMQVKGKNCLVRVIVLDDFVANEIPYGNGAFRMLIFRNKDGKAFEFSTLLDKFASLELTECETNGKTLPNFRMPKFKLDKKYHLKEALMSMGIRKLFSSGDALSNLSHSKLNGLDFMQQCVLNVNENGTDGAAASSNYNTIYAPGMINEFDINSPFGFIIQEKSTGLIVFAGAVNKL